MFNLFKKHKTKIETTRLAIFDAVMPIYDARNYYYAGRFRLACKLDSKYAIGLSMGASRPLILVINSLSRQ